MSVNCPVCSKSFDTQHGVSLHFVHRRVAGDSAHIAYEAAQEEARWAPLTEGTDYVRCLECGHRTATLGRHLMGEHKITADQYRAKHGKDTPIRCDALKAKRSLAISNRPIIKGEKKTVVCPECGKGWEGSKYLGNIHDLRCDVCRELETALTWEGKFEPEDYVTCRVCRYRAENLTSHIQNAHPDLVGKYRETYPGAMVVAVMCSVRDKTAIRGVPRSEEFKRKVSESHLALNKSIRLTLADLEPFRMKNGRVFLAQACDSLGYCYVIVRRECERLGVPYNSRGVNQFIFLDLLQDILGVPFIGEWTCPEFTNPKTGRRFVFDGYFEGYHLLTEFQGYQHYTFPNRFMDQDNEDLYQALQERDDEKRRQVLASGEYKYLDVREDEPWTDEKYLRNRLAALGLSVCSLVSV